MFDDLTAYFYENVVASYEDYLAIKGTSKSGRSKDVRAAMIAASALFHLREHLPTAHSLSRTAAEHLCPDYALLGDVVNASKHNSISGNTPHGSPLVTSAAQIHEQITITRYNDKAGPYESITKDVVVRLTNGGIRSFADVLRAVMNFWQTHLHSIGVVQNPRSYVSLGIREPKTRKECETHRLDFEVVRGMRFAQCMQILQYNYEKGEVEPVDLTGCEVRATVRQPLYDVDLYLTHEETGRELKATVSLTAEESQVVLGLKTDVEKQEYVFTLPQAQAAIRRLLEEDRHLHNPHTSPATD